MTGSMCRKEMLWSSKRLIDWWSNLLLSAGIDLHAACAGFNIICLTLGNKPEPAHWVFVFVCVQDSQYQRAVYLESFKFLPSSPAEHIPTDQHHIKVDRKPQSAGKVNCDRIVHENTILNFPPEEKSSLKTSDAVKSYRETKLSPGAGNFFDPWAAWTGSGLKDWTSWSFYCSAGACSAERYIKPQRQGFLRQKLNFLTVSHRGAAALRA